jgi:hypothetical protein
MTSSPERLAVLRAHYSDESEELGHAVGPRRRRIAHPGVLRYLRWRRIRRVICDILGHRVRQGYCYDCRRHR